MHDNVIRSKLMHQQASLNYSQQSSSFMQILHGLLFSSLLLWELVHDEIYKFALRKLDVKMHKGYYTTPSKAKRSIPYLRKFIRL